MTAGGHTSWCGFAQAIVDQSGGLIASRPRVVPIATVEYPLPARRPRNSILSCARLAARFGITLAPWQEGLARVINELRHDTSTERKAS
jgi:dTDP-4-dehydrorhamnose reductase